MKHWNTIKRAIFVLQLGKTFCNKNVKFVRRKASGGVINFTPPHNFKEIKLCQKWKLENA